MPYIIGIDPGLTGALAVIGVKNGQLHFVGDLPTMTKNKGRGRVKNQINAYAIPVLLAWKQIEFVVIENAQAMPKQGASSVFITGHTMGILEGVAASMGLNTILVAPSEWKKFYNLGKDKEQARAAAIRAFPKFTEQLSRKKDHNRAEAILIANWARIMRKRGEL